MTIIVNIKVTKGRDGEFVAATRANMALSRKEPGISRFELFQDRDDPCHLVLVEDYRDDAALASHKETAHYLKWRDLIEPMMAEPRTRALYNGIGP